MVIRKMKSFRRNVQKKDLHIFKQKVGKTGINRTGSFSWCKVCDRTERGLQGASEGKIFRMF